LAAGFALIAFATPAAAAPAQWWLTTADGASRLAPQPAISASAHSGATIIRVDPARRFQSMVGFGAAITDASADLIQALPPPDRDRLLRELFGRKDGGLGFSFTRLTVGASDFSSTHYSLDDSPGNAPDPGLSHYSIAMPKRAMLPTARAALAINPALKVMISPWSAPAWMKTSRSLIKGRLEPSAYPAFARYMVRTVKAFGREGVPVYALSLQNEPDFEPENYPGMRMGPAERAAVIGRHLGPLLARERLATRILDWDHNWDKPEMPLGVLADPVARRYVHGVAWHCYNGDVAAQSKVRDAFPDKHVFFTECSGGQWSPRFDETLAWMVRNLVIGATRHWARGVLLWNLALDPAHGPHLGGCGDCRGVVTIDPGTRAVTRNVEYYALGHASRFVLPGARRIGSDSGKDGVESVAFANPRGRGVAVLLLNGGKAKRDVAVRLGARSYSLSLPAGAVATMVVPAR
jgi:glucosylceramidase